MQRSSPKRSNISSKRNWPRIFIIHSCIVWPAWPLTCEAIVGATASCTGFVKARKAACRPAEGKATKRDANLGGENSKLGKSSFHKSTSPFDVSVFHRSFWKFSDSLKCFFISGRIWFENTTILIRPQHHRLRQPFRYVETVIWAKRLQQNLQISHGQLVNNHWIWGVRDSLILKRNWVLHRCLDCQEFGSGMFRFAWHWKAFCSKFLRPASEKNKKSRLHPLASCTMAGWLCDFCEPFHTKSANLFVRLISKTKHVAAFTTASLCNTAVSSMTLPFDGIHRVDGHLSYLPHWHGMISSSRQSKYLKSLWIPTMKGYGTPAHQRSTPSNSVLARTRASRPSSNKRGALVLQNVGWDSHKEARNVQSIFCSILSATSL